MRVFVTGGGGFLGLSLVRCLLAEGHEVCSFSRSYHPVLAELGVAQIQADLADAPALNRAILGSDWVFHVAAMAGIWGHYEGYYRANILGTQNVIEACRQAKISRLVYTSSPSVVFDGRNQNGIDESAPYPSRYLAFYPATKAAAERLVLEANGEKLSTVALRPHLIWGPGDTHLVPRVLERARKGRLALVGDGSNLVDAVYVDNAAQAHLSAAQRLSPGAPAAGKAYFITNDEPLPMRQLLNGILEAGSLPPVQKRIPSGLAFTMGTLLELGYKALGKETEPPMTRFVARQLATAHWFRQDAAKRDLGYYPKINMKEGFARLKRALQT